jgi:hypothetical protein
MALTSEGALLNHIAQLLVRIDALQEDNTRLRLEAEGAAAAATPEPDLEMPYVPDH